ncbi:ComEA family DNA-binding protein [Lysinibacter cavernae]|uniref:ComEA protein n=1 Tax=Lysinibacter cavernae TaxID=1640652 RepID=A0A7X5R068_9MICO|nr:ComEA family DNA-binding protein [Lysinibacter cavernae]NIH53015.1 comEA protein [Lysinibacter cavernae]
MTSTLPPLTAVRRRLGLEPTADSPSQVFADSLGVQPGDSRLPLPLPLSLPLPSTPPSEPPSIPPSSSPGRFHATVHEAADLPVSIPDFSRPRRDGVASSGAKHVAEGEESVVDETFRLAEVYPSASPIATRAPSATTASRRGNAERYLTPESSVNTAPVDTAPVDPAFVGASSADTALVGSSFPRTASVDPAFVGTATSRATSRISQVLHSPRQLSKMSAWAATVVFVLAIVVSAVIGMVHDRSAAVATGDTPLPPPAGHSSASPDQDRSASTAPPPDNIETADASVTDPQLYIHVLGHVSAPGLVRLEPGSRVVDAIDAAGGMLDTAEPASINLARLLSDGEQVVVLAVGETPPAPVVAESSGSATAGSGQLALVNINTATTEQLETLPRVGPALAQRIIDWRETEGPFGAVDDLLSVTGIGDKTLDGFRAQITV